MGSFWKFLEEDKRQERILKNEFAARLKKLRKEVGLTQMDVVARLHSSKTKYASYEQGKTEPSIATLIRLCEMFKVDANELLGIRRKVNE